MRVLDYGFAYLYPSPDPVTVFYGPNPHSEASIDGSKRFAAVMDVSMATLAAISRDLKTIINAVADRQL